MSTSDLCVASSGVLEANMSCLSKSVRSALERADPHTVRLGALDHFEQMLVLTPAGRWRRFHPSNDPVAAAESLRESCEGGQFPPLLIAIGLGMGFLLDAIERSSASTRVLAIEPLPAMTRAMLGRRDFSEWFRSGRLTLLVGPDYDGQQEAWRVVGNARPQVFAAPLLTREFPDLAADAQERAMAIVRGAAQNEEARRRFAGPYLLNTIRNLPAILSEGDAASLWNLFPGRPAIVVGAGPSLDRNVDELRRLQHEAVIVATDTAARPLLAAGVRPHFVVAVDPSARNGLHLRNLPDTRGIWLVSEGSVDPGVFDQFVNHTFTFRVAPHHPWPWLAALGSDRATLAAWGSVLTTAFDLARHLGCSPLVFAGADLAYTRGLLYCRNTLYESEWRRLETDEARAAEFRPYLERQPHQEEPDINGSPTWTTPHFLQFRDWLVRRAAETPGRVLNGTGGGVLQGGSITQRSLADLSFTPLPAGDRLQTTIRSAWRRSAEGNIRPRAAVLAALREPESLPLAAWTDFTRHSTTAEDIRNAAFLVTIKTVDAQSGGISFLLGLREKTDRNRRHGRDVREAHIDGNAPEPHVSHGVIT